MARLNRVMWQAGALLAAAALVTACSSASGGGSGAASSAGSTPSQSGQAPSSGAAPTSAAAASGAPASSAAASDSASPAGSSAAPAPSIGKPEKTTLNLSYSNAVMQVEKVPLHLALAGLDKQGITTKELYNQDGNSTVQQVARGDADFGTANASTVFAAIKKGVPIKAIMATYLPFYVLVAPASVSGPAGLNGLRVGIQSKVSSTTLYTDLAMATAPSAKPKILIVPGSSNRVQAMIAGQLDASVLQPADWLALNKKAPGKFHVIYDVAQKNPNIIDSLIFASTKTLQSDPNYVRTFVAAVQKQYAAVYSDPDALAKDLVTLVPKTTESVAKELTSTLDEDKIWPADGGFTGGTVQATLDAMTKSGLFKADELPTPQTCCTSEFLSPHTGG